MFNHREHEASATCEREGPWNTPRVLPAGKTATCYRLNPQFSAILHLFKAVDDFPAPSIETMAKLYSKVSHMLDHSRSAGHLSPLVSAQCSVC